MDASDKRLQLTLGAAVSAAVAICAVRALYNVYSERRPLELQTGTLHLINARRAAAAEVACGLGGNTGPLQAVRRVDVTLYAEHDVSTADAVVRFAATTGFKAFGRGGPALAVTHDLAADDARLTLEGAAASGCTIGSATVVGLVALATARGCRVFRGAVAGAIDGAGAARCGDVDPVDVFRPLSGPALCPSVCPAALQAALAADVAAAYRDATTRVVPGTVPALLLRPWLWRALCHAAFTLSFGDHFARRRRTVAAEIGVSLRGALPALWWAAAGLYHRGAWPVPRRAPDPAMPGGAHRLIVVCRDGDVAEAAAHLGAELALLEGGAVELEWAFDGAVTAAFEAAMERALVLVLAGVTVAAVHVCADVAAGALPARLATDGGVPVPGWRYEMATTDLASRGHPWTVATTAHGVRRPQAHLSARTEVGGARESAVLFTTDVPPVAPPPYEGEPSASEFTDG